jgi:hypothetical protein
VAKDRSGPRLHVAQPTANWTQKYRSIVEMKTNASPRFSPGWIVPLIASGALLVLAACTDEETHTVSAPPPVAPVTPVATATMVVPAIAPPSTVVVTQMPPTSQPEVAPPRPSPDYVWVAGHWTWNSSQYQWIAGHWAVPPSSSSHWVPPFTEVSGSAYEYHEGHWE